MRNPAEARLASLTGPELGLVVEGVPPEAGGGPQGGQLVEARRGGAQLPGRRALTALAAALPSVNVATRDRDRR